ncbi:hypothetical protein BDQ12DRAFT_613942 [Crucibulum laeve]|uniref:Uncharacterized protein n=1 Tax=Crucibulum laeve TaxID=68775 RepID=A0A5C3LQD4_9AGAR|nr:hypothetical protein BDQ12DRAFT_613942 [Crucibulum laeve]
MRDIATQLSQFVHAFSDQIEHSAPHIYVSALPFSMQNSMIRKLYSEGFPSILQIEGMMNTQNALWQCKLDSGVESVSLSPDGKYIVSGSSDQTVRVWNVETVSFSPDGKYIVSSSYDKTVRVWNVETGEAIKNYTDPHTDLTASASTSAEEINHSFLHLQPIFFHTQPHSSYTITDSGQVIGPEGQLYFWIPQHLVHRVCRPGNPVIFGVNCIKLDISKFVHGQNWITCKRTSADTLSV